MSQRFSGRNVKQISSEFRNPLASNSYWPNEVAHACMECQSKPLPGLRFQTMNFRLLLLAKPAALNAVELSAS